MATTKILSFLIIFICLANTIISSDFQIPLERNQYTALTTYQEMITFLRALDKSSDNVKIEVIGQSVEGRDLVALFFSVEKQFAKKREEKPVILLFCQQHGDEPSGKEAAMFLSRELIENRNYLLKNLDLILVPQVNPDGSERRQRENNNDMDLNRNHAVLSEPETQALHDLFRKWMPEVTLDVHEYDAITEKWVEKGLIKDAQEQLGMLSNLNISEDILRFSRDVFIPSVGNKLEKAGYRFHEYVVGTPFAGDRTRFSTTAVNDGRQSFGIYNTLSFILEGKRYGDIENNIKKRTEAQLAAMIAFLETLRENKEKILSVVNKSRNMLLQNTYHENFRSYIQMDYYPDSTFGKIQFPVFNLKTWKQEKMEFENFHATVKVRKSVQKPYAYIIPATEQKLIEILTQHRLRMYQLKTDTELDIEIYRILHHSTMMEEEAIVPYIDVEVVTETRRFTPGNYVVLLNQPAGNLIPLLLEPQSRFSLCAEGSGRKYKLDHYLEEGNEYPVTRVMQAISMLDWEEVKN